MTVAKKIAIFNTDHSKPYLAEQWGDFAEMAIRMFEASREERSSVEYVSYQIHLNEFPNIDDLRSPDLMGIYITGSQYDSFSTNVKWVVKLRELLAVVLQDDGFPPVAAVCFGHQIVAASLGCKVDRNSVGTEAGVLPIQLTDGAINLGLFQENNNGAKTLNLSEVHQDVVYEVPADFLNIGSTEKCAVQGFYKKNRLLTVQGHPEFETEVNLKIVHHMYETGAIPLEDYEQIEKRSRKLENQGPLVAKYMWKLFNGKI